VNSVVARMSPAILLRNANKAIRSGAVTSQGELDLTAAFLLLCFRISHALSSSPLSGDRTANHHRGSVLPRNLEFMGIRSC
jgi:hypothetical protein